MRHLAGPVNPLTGDQFCSRCGDKLSWVVIGNYLYEWEKERRRKWGIPHTYVPGYVVEKTPLFQAHALTGTADCIPPLSPEPAELFHVPQFGEVAGGA
jgi:hypothetical protein